MTRITDYLFVFHCSIASGPCNCKTISQTLSEGQLSTGTTAKRTSLDSVELVEDLEVDINDKIKTSLNDEGINRCVILIWIIVKTATHDISLL